MFTSGYEEFVSMLGNRKSAVGLERTVRRDESLQSEENVVSVCPRNTVSR